MNEEWCVQELFMAAYFGGKSIALNAVQIVKKMGMNVTRALV